MLRLDGKGNVMGTSSLRNFLGASTDTGAMTGTYTVDPQGVVRLNLNYDYTFASSPSQQALSYVLYPSRQNAELHGFRTNGAVRAEMIRQ
jgi:hypothetical protein